MKPITVALACLVALILMGCDDDTTPAKQHYAKHEGCREDKIGSRLPHCHKHQKRGDAPGKEDKHMGEAFKHGVTLRALMPFVNNNKHRGGFFLRKKF